MIEYCVTFVNAEDDTDVFHTHVHDQMDLPALAGALRQAAHENVDLSRATHVMMASVEDFGPAQRAAFEALRAVHHNGAPASCWVPPGGPGAARH